MKKTAFVFPGQGSQYIGMCSDFYREFACSKRMIDIASETTGIDMNHLLFEENDDINQTRFTQIAMLADELAIFEAVKESGFKADVYAGLSLGEYAAVTAAGVFTPEDAFKVVKMRGEYMQNAYPTGGAMSAVLGLDSETIEKICTETEGIVTIANYNCPGQIVITGEAAAVEKASESLKDAGAKRCIPLTVSGPFHSVLLADASKRLYEVLKPIGLGDINTPYLTNVTGDYVTEKCNIKGLLRDQICLPVKWQQCVETMISDGVDCFVEIGPKKTLSGFIKKISKDVEVYHVDKVEDLDKLPTE